MVITWTQMFKGLPLALAHRLGIDRDVATTFPIRHLTRALSRRKIVPLDLLMGGKLDVTFQADFPGASFRYHASADDLLGARLYWQAWNEWEPYVVPIFASYATSASRILDVGAHTGIYTLFACALNPKSEVYGFEPIPRVYPLLTTNVHLNQFDSRCKLFQVAVSDLPGVCNFHVAEDASMSAITESGEIKVDVVVLDNLVPLDGRTDLVKIDVEGHEYRVLCGMENIIRDSHPTILFECNPGAPGKQVGDLLRSHNYRLFRLIGGDRQEIDELVPERFRHGNHNFLARHPSRS